ncbi:MAG: hypothetical protein CMH56_08505 [Myxococcales bacterium]|nr:hypothetical protein [Myxococcales bacterium]
MFGFLSLPQSTVALGAVVFMLSASTAHSRFGEADENRNLELAILPSGQAVDLGPHKIRSDAFQNVRVQDADDVNFYLNELADLNQLCELTKVPCTAAVGKMLGADLVLQMWSPEGNGDIFRIVSTHSGNEIHRQVVPSQLTANELSAVLGETLQRLLVPQADVGQLRVEIPENGTRLFVDGVDYGKVEKGALVAQLTMGKHQVVLDAPTSGFQNQEFEISPGQETRVAFADNAPSQTTPALQTLAQDTNTWTAVAGWTAIGAGAIASGIGTLFHFAHPIHETQLPQDASGSLRNHIVTEQERKSQIAYVLWASGLATATAGATYLLVDGLTE